MKRYGEAHPPLIDDRLSMLLVILDGLGDRSHQELGGKTPLEAATSPRLDNLATKGISGIHMPFGPGRAASSEIAHWSMFGYDDYPFVGRSVLEGLGHGLEVPSGFVHFYGSLRCSEVRDDVVWITGRATPSDTEDAKELITAINGFEHEGFNFQISHTKLGEALIMISGNTSAEVTDTDPFFEDIHPWMQPLAYAESSEKEKAERTALSLQRYLVWCRELLVRHEINSSREARGLPALDTLTTKWVGKIREIPTFCQQVGVDGGAVTSSALYRGLAQLLGLRVIDLPSRGNQANDLVARFKAALDLLNQECSFVHVHIKSTDEAGHSKDPLEKVRVIEAIDSAFEFLEGSGWDDVIITVTGDHATPSSGGVLHTGDPTPLVIVGPTVRKDSVELFGESSAASGSLGVLRAADILPTMLSYANRPRFMGARAHPWRAIGLVDDPRPMPLDS